MANKTTRTKNGARQGGVSPAVLIKEPQNALHILLKELNERLDVDRTSMWMINRAGDEIHLAFGHDRRQGQVQARPRLLLDSQPELIKAIRDGQPFHTEDVSQSPQFAWLAEARPAERKIKSALAFPAPHLDEPAWMICFESRATRIWVESDIKTAGAAIDELEPVLEALEMRGARRTLTALGEIQTSFDQGELSLSLERIVELGSEVIQADGGLAYLKIDERSTLQCVVSHKTHANWLGGVLLGGGSPAAVGERAKKATLLSDCPDWSGSDEMYETEEIASMICLPAAWKERTLGMLLFFRRSKERPLNRSDLETLGPLVALAGSIMQVDRFQEEIRRQEAFRQVFKGIGEISLAASSRSDLLTTSLELICRELRSTSAVAAVGERFTTMGMAPGIGKALIEFIRSSGLDLAAIQVIADWEYPPMELSIKEDILRLGFRTTLIAPLRSGSQKGGILIIGAHEPRNWLPAEIALVEVCGELLSAAVERMDAAMTLEDQTLTLRMLETAGQSLNRKGDQGAILNRIGEGVMSLAKTYRAALMLMKADRTVYIPWMSGLTRAYADEVTAQDAEYFTRLFSLPGGVVLTREAHSNRDHALLTLLRGEQFHTISIWPLLYDDRVVAVMVCYFDGPPVLRSVDQEMIKTFLRQAAMTIVSARRMETLERQYVQVASVLAKAVSEMQNEAFETSHSSKIELARELARQLAVSESEIDAIYWAALLHDIGKADVPRTVLNKPGKLDARDWEIIRQVPVYSEKYLGGITHLRDAAHLVRHVREHYDGDGYPDRLTGDEIPLGARILAVVDAYQAMKEKRPYHDPRSHEEAVAELVRSSGKQFDPRVVKTFVQAAQKGPGGERQN